MPHEGRSEGGGSMWVLQREALLNLRHAVEVVLQGRFIRRGFVDGTGGTLELGSEEEAQRFFKVVMHRLGRLEGVLVAEGVKDAGQG